MIYNNAKFKSETLTIKSVIFSKKKKRKRPKLKEKRTVLEVRAVLGGGEVHLDVVEVFALAQVVVIRGGEKPSSVSPHDRFQVPSIYVER